MPFPHGSFPCWIVLEAPEGYTLFSGGAPVTDLPFWHQCKFHLRDRQSSFCFARNHQSPKRNLPLRGGCRCKANDRLVDCAAAPLVLTTWFDSITHQALNWTYKGPGGGQLITETTTLGMVRNVLGPWCRGRRRDIGEDEEFVIAKLNFLLAVGRGFAWNLPADLRHTFVREVCKWAGEFPPRFEQSPGGKRSPCVR